MRAGAHWEDLLIKLNALPDRSGGFMKRLLSPYISYPHQCMYDAKRLIAIMQEVGFDAACKKSFESKIESIHDIERADRTVDAVIAEGKKP